MQLIQSINHFLWSWPLLFLLMGTHLYFTFRLGFIQRKVFQGIRLSLTGESPSRKKTSRKKPFSKRRILTKTSPKNPPGETSSSPSGFAALMTTLAATIGTGNIIGMSTAVALGGPGAVFWCWLTGIFGMSTSYAECYLAHHFRRKKADGTYAGGAMYLFRDVLGRPGMAFLYAGAAVAASLLIGCACQSNSISAACASTFHISPSLCGMICALLAAAVIVCGCRFVSRVCAVLVPFMGIFYIICCFILLYLTKDTVHPALKLIVRSAFSKESLTGGILGGGLTAALRYGIARGLFTNEAGMGTAGIASASADTQSSHRQALISMTGVFWDTVVMCGITGLLIVAGFLKDPAGILACSPGGLTLAAFSFLPGGEQLLSISLILFAFSTIIGWFFLGEHAFTYLTSSEKALSLYKAVYLTALFLGAVLSLELVWELTDLCNLFLLLPNVYLLLRLKKQVSSKP